MRLIKAGDGLFRQPPAPNSPTVTVVAGGEPDGPDVGLVRVDVPAGGGMAPHKHNGSDVILAPVAGVVRIRKGEESVDVGVGDSILIGKEETVSLANPGDITAHLIVAAGPTDFIAAIRAWPAPRES